ncbi:MAG: ABC transporter ATP-binding protein [Methanomicrobium sp.]|nr:ABC transporter ATP-binding protein [Methanomicrobium sp.]MDD4299145.1 ABC transporter ATP-binding protein [Methanomicrobium sp.]
MHKTAVDVRDVTFFKDGQKILDSINFTIEEGQSYAVIGPNGGGKTTLLKVILGLVKPDSGSVRIYGETPEKNRWLLGYVPQFHTFDFTYPVNVLDMVLLGRLGHIRGIRKKYSENDYENAREALSLLGILDLSDRPLGSLSGGEQQRAIIARAIAGKPKILLLDEPTVYVDSPTEDRFHEILAQLHRKMTIVLITHDIGVLSSDIDVIACLNRKLYTHNTNEITDDMLLSAYKCPVDLIAHGLAHRVLKTHED